MKKIFIIKNEDDFRSLMVDLEREGARWESGCKPTELEYDHSGKIVEVEDNTITYYSSLRTFSYALEDYGIEEEIHIIPYTAKPENLEKYRTIPWLIEDLKDFGSVKGNIGIIARLDEIKAKAEEMEYKLLKYCNIIEDLKTEITKNKED